METLKQIINTHVEMVNDKWYDKKEKEFKKYNGGSSVNILGKLVIQEVDIIKHEDEVGDQVGPNEVEISSRDFNFDFVTYCNYYLPLDELTDWGSYPVYDYYLDPHTYKSYNIPEMVSDLLNELEKFIVLSTSSFECSQAISKIIELVYDSIVDRKNVFDKELCNEILDSYLDEFVSSINLKYSRQLTHNTLVNELKNKLDFKLTQDQLLSLLYIIYSADFFTSNDYSPAVRFFFNNFTYKNDSGEQVAPLVLTNFQKKFSAIRASQSSKTNVPPSGLNFIKTKLAQVIRGIS